MIKKQEIHVIANQLLTKELASGGDILSFEILSNMAYSKIVVYTPSLAAENIRLFLKKVSIHSTDQSKIIPNTGYWGGVTIIYLYFKRTINTITKLVKAKNLSAIYLTGDFFCNTIPAVIKKIIHPDTKLFCNFYHLNPLPWKRKNNIIFSSASWILQRFSIYIAKPYVNKYFVLSQEGKEILTKLGIDRAKIFISGAGVNSAIYKTKSSKDYSNYDILFVGRLNKTKGVYDAIKCLEIIKNQLPRVKMGVVGASSKTEMNEIKRLIKNKKLTKNVHFFGYVSNNKKIKLMKSTPVLMAPSHEEGFGIGVLEGIACGMTVVAYDLSVYKLIFERYRSRINYVPVGDIGAMAKSIVNSLNKKNGRSLSIKVTTWNDVANIQYREIIGKAKHEYKKSNG